MLLGKGSFLKRLVKSIDPPRSDVVGVAKVANNWASEASPTLGCSIEISCDIYNYYTSKSGIWLDISRLIHLLP